MISVPKHMAVVSCLLCALIGYMAHKEQVVPDFSPKPKRPFLSAVIRIAKSALWVLAFADQPPSDTQVDVHSLMIDDMASDYVNHSRGW